MSSSSVAPLSLVYCRWKVSCSAFPPAMSAATVIRLRSRGDSCGRFHTSPNRTSSVKCTRPGAKSPSICSAADGAESLLLAVMVVVLSGLSTGAWWRGSGLLAPVTSWYGCRRRVRRSARLLLLEVDLVGPLVGRLVVQGPRRGRSYERPASVQSSAPSQLQR